MTHQITVHTYLELKAGIATLIEDVPVELTIRGEDDGCGDLHWWIDEIKAEFIGNDLIMSGGTAVAEGTRRSTLLEDQVMRQLYTTAENDESVAGEVADQLAPLVLGRAA